MEIRPFRACAVKNVQYNPYLWPNWRNFRALKEIGVEEHDGDVRFKSGIWPFRACAMNPAIIIGTVRSLWTWLCMQIPVSIFLVINNNDYHICIAPYAKLLRR